MIGTCAIGCFGLRTAEPSGENFRRRMAPLAVCVCPFCQMADDGTLEAVFRALSSDADMKNLNLDLTCIKVHKSANGGGKTADKAVGRTKEEWNTKLHTIVDGLGNPKEFLLSAGNDHESVHAVELLERIEIRGSNILADRAYGAKTIRDYISEHGAAIRFHPKAMFQLHSR